MKLRRYTVHVHVHIHHSAGLDNCCAKHFRAAGVISFLFLQYEIIFCIGEKYNPPSLPVVKELVALYPSVNVRIFQGTRPLLMCACYPCECICCGGVSLVLASGVYARKFTCYVYIHVHVHNMTTLCLYSCIYNCTVT